jgi:hypothetical protein
MIDEHSFYSMDRLIEFGMSMSIAQQMTRSMNEMMGNTGLPPSQFAPPPPSAPPQVPERLYYVALEGKQAGPFSETEVVRLIADKKLSKETLVWHPGLPAWRSAENVPEILRLVALTPPALEVTTGGIA